MGRPLRHRPESGLTEITHRTAQGRFLLKPGAVANALILGVLGRALGRYAVELHDYVFLSNHYHLLISFLEQRELSRFMGYLNTNLAKELNRVHGWSGSLFHGRYKSIGISEEPEAQLNRLEYLLSQGVKEGLVASRRDWPGAHGTSTLLGQGPTSGTWIDRTAVSRSSMPGEAATETEFSTSYDIPLVPMPFLQSLPEEERIAMIQGLLEGIEEREAVRHEQEGTQPIGAEAVLAVDPHAAPERPKKRQAPFCHAATRSARKAMIEAYRSFEASFREAVEELRQGFQNVVFPPDCFPPPVLLAESGRPVHPGYG